MGAVLNGKKPVYCPAKNMLRGIALNPSNYRPLKTWMRSKAVNTARKHAPQPGLRRHEGLLLEKLGRETAQERWDRVALAQKNVDLQVARRAVRNKSGYVGYVCVNENHSGYHGLRARRHEPKQALVTAHLLLSVIGNMWLLV